jgi:hypothetical protein
MDANCSRVTNPARGSASRSFLTIDGHWMGEHAVAHDVAAAWEALKKAETS